MSTRTNTTANGATGSGVGGAAIAGGGEGGGRSASRIFTAQACYYWQETSAHQVLNQEVVGGEQAE